MRRRYKVIAFLLVLAATVYLTVCAVFVIQFPAEIRLTEYTIHHMSFKLPLNAVIQNETVSVLKVNNTPVSDNITVSLQSPLTIETDAGGTAGMTINAFGLPVKKVTLDIVPDLEVIPCGMTVGVRINTDGVMVLGMGGFRGEDNQTYKPCDGKLKPGDMIISVNNVDIKNNDSLLKAVADSTGDITLHIRRDGELMNISITPVVSAKDGVRRIGVWVRDSTKGIGTITYYNPSNHVFGALGHGIMDVDTRKLMSVKDGIIMASEVKSVKKGAKGTPGELEGAVKAEKILGHINTNSPYGIYGIINLSAAKSLPEERVKVATASQIHEGPAKIRTNVASNTVKDYDIYIENVNRYATDETKGMVIRITDPELLRLTNGIVQGMSGSPILQDGRLIGAVTHVFVQDPTKGYGIFIENMIKQEQLING